MNAHAGTFSGFLPGQASAQTHHRWQAAAFLLAFLGVVFSTWAHRGSGRVPLVLMARQALGFQVRPALWEGVVVDLKMQGAASSLEMTTMDGHDRQLLLNTQTTSVFVPGAVLSPSHLRPGQHIQVMASLQGQRAVVRAIRIVKGP